MKIICFLRSLGISINAIEQLLAEKHPENVIDLLLQQQEMELKDEIRQHQEKLDKLLELQKELKAVERFSVESIGDIAVIMENKKKLHKIRWMMLGVGLVLEAVEIGTIMLWVLEGIWWPFAFIGLPIVIALCAWISVYYFRNVAYICPECHQVFKPKLKEAFWASHTPTTRKLTCPHCAHKGFCVEIYGGKDA